MSFELLVTFQDRDWPHENTALADLIQRSPAFVSRPNDDEFWLRDPGSGDRPYDVRIIRRESGLLIEAYALSDAFWVATRDILEEIRNATPIELRNDDGEPYSFAPRSRP